MPQFSLAKTFLALTGSCLAVACVAATRAIFVPEILGKSSLAMFVSLVLIVAGITVGVGSVLNLVTKPKRFTVIVVAIFAFACWFFAVMDCLMRVN